MKKNLLLLCICLSSITAAAQLCNSNRFSEVNFFSRSQIQFETGVFGQARNINGQQQILRYNMYYPKLGVDALVKRPFIMMIFGGAFVGGSRQTQDTLCLMFARRGFIAASIDYRLGYDTTSCRDSLTKAYAVYRAQQDAHAAMRYFAANANTWRLDTSKMLVGGGSAGAATALNLTYATQNEIRQSFPKVVDSLGRLDTSGNNLRTPFRIKGVFNNWGGLNRDYYDAADAVPMISFHGEKDDVVPIDSFASFDCLKAPPVVLGSRALYQRLKAAGVCSDLTVALRGGHGVFNNNNTEKEFRVSKAACFFRSVFCGNCRTVLTTDTIPARCATVPPPAVATAAPPGPIQVQPNPVSSLLFINGIVNPAAADIKVYDLTGGLRLSAKGVNRMDVQALPPGSYLLRVNSNGKPYQATFIKQ